MHQLKARSDVSYGQVMRLFLPLLGELDCDAHLFFSDVDYFYLMRNVMGAPRFPKRGLHLGLLPSNLYVNPSFHGLVDQRTERKRMNLLGAYTKECSMRRVQSFSVDLGIYLRLMHIIMVLK